jgi:RimJ/RimL family protein N-acetyltransferase
MSFLVYDHKYKYDIARFVADRIGMESISAFGDYKALGWFDGERLVSGAVYCDFNGKNVWAHLATDVPLTREFLFAGWDFPFRVMGVDRVTGWVEANNEKALALNFKLGYAIEATLKGAARDGGDVHLMVMWKDKCRWLRLGDRYAG